MRFPTRTTFVSVLALTFIAAAACGTDRPASQPSGRDAETVIPNLDAAATATQTPVPTATPTANISVPKPAPTPTPVGGSPTPYPTPTPPRPFIDVPGVIKSFPDIPPPRGRNLEPPYLTGDQILERIGELAPGFVGIYKSGTKLVIILNDDSQIDRAIAAVAAFYGANEIGETVRIERGEIEFLDLAAWYRTAKDIVWQVGGVYSSHIDEQNGLIEFGVVTEKTAETAREALKGSGIPEGIVVFDVKPRKLLSQYPANVRSQPGVEIELEAPTEVRPGETVGLAVVLVNRGEGTVEFIYNASTPEDIILFQDGVEVWSNKGRFGAFTLAGRVSVLASGESVRFDSEWTVIDNDLEPLSPGKYQLVAAFDFSEEGGSRSRHLVVTEPVELTVPGD